MVQASIDRNIVIVNPSASVRSNSQHIAAAMGDQPSSPESGQDRVVSRLDGYQFTFNCSATSSRSSSYIEPDPNAESAFMDDSRSLPDSVRDFPEHFGRTYHAYKEGSYAFPNDAAEQERMLLHNATLVKLMGDKLFFAPLSQSNPPHAILDIATGTGDWAIAMGDHFPNSQIIATDLSPIQPADVPPNVNFYVEDASEPWDYTQRFDYIHTRCTGGCWSSFEVQIAEQAFAALSPGGWFESQELDAVPHSDDGTLDPDSALAHWFHDLLRAADACKRSLSQFTNLRAIYERVGFVDVQERVFKVPFNGWPKDERLKEIGKMWEQNMQMGLSGFCLGLFNRVLQRTPTEIEVSLMDVRRELSDTSIHGYLPVYVVWGRKPFPGEKSNPRTKHRK